MWILIIIWSGSDREAASCIYIMIWKDSHRYMLVAFNPALIEREATDFFSSVFILYFYLGDYFGEYVTNENVYFCIYSI